MTAEREALQETAREFVRREVAPYLQDWEDDGSVPRELHLAAAKQGLLGVSFPEEVGGQGGSTRSRCRRRSSRPAPRAD
jgi:acyl-CoA dehydrogenase